MRTVEIKDLDSGKIVWRGHYWFFYQAKERAKLHLPPGSYAIQGTNSSACNPRITHRQWLSAETFEI
jgi:hypothetical protein